jgi:hypothetical protein
MSTRHADNCFAKASSIALKSGRYENSMICGVRDPPRDGLSRPGVPNSLKAMANVTRNVEGLALLPCAGAIAVSYSGRNASAGSTPPPAVLAANSPASRSRGESAPSRRASTDQWRARRRVARAGIPRRARRSAAITSSRGVTNSSQLTCLYWSCQLGYGALQVTASTWSHNTVAMEAATVTGSRAPRRMRPTQARTRIFSIAIPIQVAAPP